MWDWAGQLGESGVSLDGKGGEWYVDIWDSKVVAPTCVNWGPFIVDPWTSIWLCTNRIPDLWGLINRCSSMIVVVGRYPTIPLEMSIGIVYRPPTDSPACGITWKMCTRERWDPDRPYCIIVKCCHTFTCWSGLYPCRIGYWFRSPRHPRTWVIACSLPPLVEMHVYYYDVD
jgi:hypothetical protein